MYINNNNLEVSVLPDSILKKMPSIKPAFKMMLCISILISNINLYAQDQLKVLQNAFDRKDTSVLTHTLSDRFAIAGFTDQSAKFCLQQILNRHPVTQIEAIEKDSKRLIVLFKDDKGKIDSSKIQLDENGRIKQIELFDRLYGVKRAQNPKLIAKIPFENKNGSILLKLTINGHQKPLKLLFDTGADGMALNESKANELGLLSNKTNNASVVGGTQQIKVSEGNSVEIADLKLENMAIAIFPNRTDESSDGIFGNAILRRYITQIDYDKSEISLYEFGDFQYPEDGKLVPITFPSGVIHVKASLSIAGETAVPSDFIFDTGAGYSLIGFRPYVKKHKLLVSGFKSEVSSSTSSLGIVTPTFTGYAQTLRLGSLDAISNFPISLMGGSAANKNWNPGADGSIGVRVISRYNHIINLVDGEIYMSPNKLDEYPQDFLIQNYLFGWNNSGQLILLDQIGAPDSDKKGKIVRAINGDLSEKIAKNEKLITKYKSTKDKTVQITFEDQSNLTID